MAAITNLSDYINLQTGGGNGNPTGVFTDKNGRINGANGITGAALYISQWIEDGLPCAGEIPTTASIPTNATQGAIPLTAPGGSRQKWLVGIGGSSRRGGLVVLYDRLMHCGGLSGSITTSQTVQGDPASPAITRNTGGIGNLIMIEIYTTLGTTSAEATITYINDANVSKTVASAGFGGTQLTTAAPGYCVICPLAAGDLGVKSITSVQLGNSTGATGNWGVSIIRPIALLSLPQVGSVTARDYISGIPVVPELLGTECLATYSVPLQGNTRNVRLWLSTVEK